MGRRFSTVLVANRGEIAVRVLRSARALGYRTVAVFSDADRDAPHVRAADRAVHIGPPPARESYLSIEALLEAARRTGAEAIHPGYGFLSENAAFGRAVQGAGLAFIGPPVEALEVMGSKRQAKERMIAAGVPCVPGFHDPAADGPALLEAARRLGFPLMIKASLGGGGKGLRRVEHAGELEGKLALARAEAEASFGSGELILERAIVKPRHVEIQVFGDEQGNVIHLGERDCSTQRRHQKVIEEAPSPAVDEELRRHMGEAAVQAARSIGYVGAGTVEFLLGADRAFYFMEMNTRLQVEHPVTEAITGLDLVAWQLRVAQGEPLPLRQEDVRSRGHAIELRLYAEDPSAGFLPSTGRIEHLRWPAGEGLRIDHGLAEGALVSAHYDPLLAKLIGWGETREEARRRLLLALEALELEGPAHNRDFLLAALRHPTFVNGETTTDFLEASELMRMTRPEPRDLDWALAALLYAEIVAPHWSSTGVLEFEAPLACQEVSRSCRVAREGGRWRVSVGTQTVELWARVEDQRLVFEHEGLRESVGFVRRADTLTLFAGGAQLRFTRPSPLEARAGGAKDRELRAPMSGRVVKVLARERAAVTRGEVMLVMEAMKMQLEITARSDATVASIHVAEGDQVESKQLLMDFAEDPAEETGSST